MYGKTRHNRIRNDNIKERVEVVPIVEKVMNSWLTWFEHVKWRFVDSIKRKVDQINDS